MSKQLLDVGDTVNELEVVAVRYNENEEGEKVNFEYTLKHPDDIVRDEEAVEAE